MREDLIKILANIGSDYAGTIEGLEAYVVTLERNAFNAAKKPAKPSLVTGMNDLEYDTFEDYKSQQ